jgi:hypothetical protein
LKNGFLAVLCGVGLWGASAVADEVVIHSTANAGETNIGDYWLGEDFAHGFAALGEQVNTLYRFDKTQIPADVGVYLRGYTKFTPPYAESKTVLYVYYPMRYFPHSGVKKPKAYLNKRVQLPENTSLDDDWQNYDVLAVASVKYAKELQEAGINAYYVPQFTNPERFYPEVVDELRTDILFVGSNWHDRTSLRYALESGFDVAVYGYNWDGIVPERLYVAPYIANADLHRYYASAKIVLNDHRPDMKAAGFVNNRIYDATASGALVVSDYMDEIKDFYGDCVPMYRSKEELQEILTYYLSHEAERQEKAACAREVTLKYFTDRTVAALILRLAE